MDEVLRRDAAVPGGQPGALPDIVIAIEFRNRSWFGDRTNETLTFLRDRGLAYVSIDGPRSGATVPSLPALTAATSVFRLHGRNVQGFLNQVQGKSPSVAEKYGYLYETQELEEIARAAGALNGRAERVHLAMNNNRGDWPAINWLQLKEMLPDDWHPPDRAVLIEALEERRAKKRKGLRGTMTSGEQNKALVRRFGWDNITPMHTPARLLLVLAAVPGLTAAPAFGHVRSEPGVPDAAGTPAVTDALSNVAIPDAISADGSPEGGLILAVAALVALAACVLMRRRSAAATLALVLTLATFEMALHATHHGGDAAAEAKCVGAQAASNLVGADPGAGVSATIVPLVCPLPVTAAPSLAPTRAAAPVVPRAPPIATS